jgi:hypothetical protein
MRRRPVPLAIAAAAGIAACGGTGSSQSGATSTATAQPPATQTTAPGTAAQPLVCPKARKVLVAALRSSLRAETGASGVKRVSVVAVNDPPKARVAGFRRGVSAVSAAFTGRGIKAGTVGVWAVSRDMLRTGHGRAIASDSVTREFSALGAGASSVSPAAAYALKIAQSAAGRRARGCAEGG